MRRLARAVAALLVLVVAAPAAATGPELGARITPSTVSYPEQDAVSVTSLATIPVRVTFAVDAAGWSLGATEALLGPGETATVPITGAGPTDARLRASMTAYEPQGGVEATALTLSAPLRHAASQGVAWAPWMAAVPLALLAVAIILYGLWRALSTKEAQT